MISLRNIGKVYDTSQVQVQALRGISLDIRKGEFVSIVGPSGSGKTTLMDILGCLSRPTAGEYHFDNRNITGASDDALAGIRNSKIGFVFQTFNLLPRLSALQNVELPLVYGGVPARERNRRAREVLEAVGLADRIHHKPSALSGGQVQRVAIARALVNHPSLILADEPTGNLDSASEADVVALFTDLHRKGNTLIIVTHEESIADRAERKISIRDGRIISDAARK
ncbi:MAG: ABC transporter ATP-binding protein [Candidatus Abyssobacteria bacterium SURF_5]|uniref:ABC transporter ATP-binding protein n=1 Tax=Abyssobacteria bacterium (strain SURF_5) TaxID=2093360 RepID=A0A3A4NEK4_ABYX5|nr:MAG: ABC transporter ATP-binding protein [Candidatus Abyssubacteria bacterium SURF_5]